MRRRSRKRPDPPAVLPSGRLFSVDLVCQCCGTVAAGLAVEACHAFVVSHYDPRMTACELELDDGSTQRWELTKGR